MFIKICSLFVISIQILVYIALTLFSIFFSDLFLHVHWLGSKEVNILMLVVHLLCTGPNSSKSSLFPYKLSLLSIPPLVYFHIVQHYDINDY